MWSRIRGREDGGLAGAWPPVQLLQTQWRVSRPCTPHTKLKTRRACGGVSPSCGIMCPLCGATGGPGPALKYCPLNGGSSLCSRSGATQPAARSALSKSGTHPLQPQPSLVQPSQAPGLSPSLDSSGPLERLTLSTRSLLDPGTT